MQAYNKKLVNSLTPTFCPEYLLSLVYLNHPLQLILQAEGSNGAEEEESDKSKSEVNDNEEDDDESGEVCKQAMFEVCNSNSRTCLIILCFDICRRMMMSNCVTVWDEECG